MSLQVRSVGFHRLPMTTRFPFRYGIASMTEVPHLFVTVEVEIDGTMSTGMSADGLPPKWFTKNPDTTFEDDDLPEMLRVIRHAADLAIDAGEHAGVFDWWHEMYRAQLAWAGSRNVPPLLAGLGASLMERAVLDAWCRAHQTTIFKALQSNALEINLAALRPELRGVSPASVLATHPRNTIMLRHTVGLGDPLTDHDIQEDERLTDGLPHSLVACIRRYGLSYFKIKLCGDLDTDRERLRRVAEILNREVRGVARFTLDGNENYRDIEQFREHWDAHRSDSALREFFDKSLLFVEQPLHRSTALVDGVAAALQNWPDAPPIIIDECDAELDSLPRALDLGYSGTSHKNCKGIIKGVAQLATVSRRREEGCRVILSAEDLGNVGPVALLQDLAVVAALGIEHVERNGQHYFAGLSMYSDDEQQRVLRDHGDLYSQTESGFAALTVTDGLLQLASVNSAPFGVAEHPDVSAFEEWVF